MKREQIITELERLALLVNVSIRYEKMGTLAGGLCRIDNCLFLFINKSLSEKSRIELLANELRNLPWEEHFVKPEVRMILESG